MPKKIKEHYTVNKRKKKKPELYVIEPNLDFMKYYKLCKTWIRLRYGIDSTCLEYMLFLYSEPMFTYEDVLEWERVLGFKRNLYFKLKRLGFIEDWLPNDMKRKAVMKLTFSAKRIITEFYKVLAQRKRLEYEPRKVSKFPITTKKLLDTGTIYYNSWYDRKRSASAAHLKGVGEDKKTIR